MKIRRFSGKDMREALKQVKDELGGNAVIMSNKKTSQGVELVAAIDPMEQQTPAQAPAPAALAQEVSPKNEIKQQNESSVRAQASLREVIGDADTDSLEALLQRTHHKNENQYGQTEINVAPDENNRHASSLRADENMVRSPAFSEVSVSPMMESEVNVTPPPSVLEPEQLEGIRGELESIKNVLKHQITELSEERKKRNNPVQHFLQEQMIGMGLSSKLAEQLINFLPPQIGEVEGWNYLLNLLSNRISTGNNEILSTGGIIGFVGPTGSGKTTTLAKLAAKYAQKYGPEQVAIITIDSYRIAAYEQLATYAKIIGCAVGRAQSSQELSQLLYQLRNKSLILIDTAGFSQRDERLVEQLKQFEGAGNEKVKLYLTLPAGSQYSLLNETTKTYASADLKGCIFTKLDECYSLGEALSTVIENDLPLSYVTDGQRVPEDIKLANASNLALVAARLYKKYGSGIKTSNEKSTVGSL